MLEEGAPYRVTVPAQWLIYCDLLRDVWATFAAQVTVPAQWLIYCDL